MRIGIHPQVERGQKALLIGRFHPGVLFGVHGIRQGIRKFHPKGLCDLVQIGTAPLADLQRDGTRKLLWDWVQRS